MHPDDSIQAIIRPATWWVANEHRNVCRGALVWAFVAHVDQIPNTLEPVGRKEDDRHDSAIFRVGPLRKSHHRSQTDLPVAALPLYPGEVFFVSRAKMRPCLVIGSECPVVDKNLVRGMPKRSTAPTVLVAPYYGADKDGSRGGYNAAFVERVRHCEYPQFVWDMLPVHGPKESILRLDHIQPVGGHYNAFELTDFRLCDDALGIIDEILMWVMRGGVPEDSLIALYRQEIEAVFGD